MLCTFPVVFLYSLWFPGLFVLNLYFRAGICQRRACIYQFQAVLHFRARARVLPRETDGASVQLVTSRFEPRVYIYCDSLMYSSTRHIARFVPLNLAG